MWIITSCHLIYFLQISDFRPAMSDISKEELKKEIEEILKDADLDNTSAKKAIGNNLPKYVGY